MRKIFSVLACAGLSLMLITGCSPMESIGEASSSVNASSNQNSTAKTVEFAPTLEQYGISGEKVAILPWVTVVDSSENGKVFVSSILNDADENQKEEVLAWFKEAFASWGEPLKLETPNTVHYSLKTETKEAILQTEPQISLTLTIVEDN